MKHLFEAVLKANERLRKLANPVCFDDTIDNTKDDMKDEWNNCSKLPPQDTEVIVLDKSGKISFGHQVNPEIAKNWDGWNIPDIMFWRPCSFTEEMNKYYNSENAKQQ